MRRLSRARLAVIQPLLCSCELTSLGYLQDGPRDASVDHASHGDDATVDHGTDGPADGSPPLPYILIYHFDGDAKDSSGNGHDGMLLGGATVDQPGVRGNALSCALPGDALLFAADAFQPGRSSFSIAFFFRLTVSPDGGPAVPQNTFFDKGGAWDDSTNMSPGVGIGFWTSAPDYLQAFVNDGAPGAGAAPAWTRAGYQPPPVSPLTDGQFHHMAFVVDRGQEIIFAYVDGLLRGTSALSPDPDEGGPFGSVDAPTPGTLCAEGDPRWTLDGSIDEFMIVGAAMSEKDVQDLLGVVRRSVT